MVLERVCILQGWGKWSRAKKNKRLRGEICLKTGWVVNVPFACFVSYPKFLKPDDLALILKASSQLYIRGCIRPSGRRLCLCQKYREEFKTNKSEWLDESFTEKLTNQPTVQRTDKRERFFGSVCSCPLGTAGSSIGCSVIHPFSS